MNTINAYYEYSIEQPNMTLVKLYYRRNTQVTLANGEVTIQRWIQFKIRLRNLKIRLEISLILDRYVL
jgi:hypothetical protein